MIYNKKHCIVAADAVADALGKATKVIGEGLDPFFLVWTGGKGPIFEGCPRVLVDDRVDKEFVGSDVGRRSNVPPLQRVVEIVEVCPTGCGSHV